MKRYSVVGVGLLCALGGLLYMLVINPAWVPASHPSSREQLSSTQVSTKPIDIIFVTLPDEEGGGNENNISGIPGTPYVMTPDVSERQGRFTSYVMDEPSSGRK